MFRFGSHAVRKSVVHVVYSLTWWTWCPLYPWWTWIPKVTHRCYNEEEVENNHLQNWVFCVEVFGGNAVVYSCLIHMVGRKPPRRCSRMRTQKGCVTHSQIMCRMEECVVSSLVLGSFRLLVIVLTLNCYIIKRHVIPHFTLPLLLPIVIHICMCRPVSRLLSFPQPFLVRFYFSLLVY